MGTSKIRLCACCVVLCVTTGRAGYAQDASQPPAQVQALLQKGGQNWSAPEQARSVFGSVSGGARFWIWPAEDRVLEVRRRTPKVTLNWQLRPQQPAVDPTDTENLMLRFQAVTGNLWTGGTSSTFSKKLDGIATGATGGTFEVSLGDNAGDGRVLVFLMDAKTPPIEALSNLLQITLKIVDGEGGYVPPAPGMTDGWSTTSLATRSRTITSLSFSPDGKTLASAGADGSILLWDVQSGVSASLASSAHKGFTHVQFSADGGTLVSWSRSDPRVKIWDATARRANGEVQIASGREVSEVVFVPNTRALAVLSLKVARPIPGQGFADVKTAEIVFWDAAAKRATGTIRAETNRASIDNLTFSADGRIMATWYGKTMMLWDVNTLAPVGAALAEHQAVIGAVAFTADGKELAVLDREKTLTRWNVEDRTRISQSGLAKDRELTFVAFSDDGRTLALGGDDRAVLLWDVTADKSTGVLLAEHPDGAAKGVFNSDRSWLVSGTARQLLIWELSSGRVVSRCTTEGPALAPNRWMLAISDDGRNVAIGRQDGGIVTICRARPR